MNLIRLIRYRFFLFAGIFPYLLGQAIAFNLKGSIDWRISLWGFCGIFLALIGVELFNEYFDAKEGGDRIFSQKGSSIPHHFFPLGIFVFVLAFSIALYLTFQIGWPILLFSVLGFLAAYFYVGPPFRWAYRGLGEIVIALSYGPFMLLGSYYLQAREINFIPFIVSLVCGFCIFSLAVLNEIPDYIQDRLVGKRNIVVRFGKVRAMRFSSQSLFYAFVILGVGVWLKAIPYFSMVIFLSLPFVLYRIRSAGKNLENPRSFIPVIRTAIVTYIIMVLSLGIGYIRS